MSITLDEARKILEETPGYFLSEDNSDPPQLWLWRGEPGDETAEPWQRVSALRGMR